MARNADRAMKELKAVKKRISQRLSKAMGKGHLSEERDAIDREAARWWSKGEGAKSRRRAK